MAREQGLTLIELLVVVALLALGVSLSAPVLTQQSLAWEARQATRELSKSLRTARAEATARNQRVTLCRSRDGRHCAWDPAAPEDTGGWEHGWILFAERPTNERQILRIRHFPETRLRVTGNSPVRDYVSFTGLGAARRRHGGLQIGTLTICTPTHGQAIVLSRSGRMRLQSVDCTP